MSQVEQVYESAILTKDFQTGRYVSYETDYRVFDVDSEETAVAAVEALIPLLYKGMSLVSVSSSERTAETTWTIKANYEYKAGAADDEPESTFSFDTSGGTKHITHSIRTVSKASVSPDYKQAINYNGETVSGVDITMPVMNFSETHYFKPSRVNTAFKKKIAALTGKVNDAAFKGYEKGEVLFLGASGSRQGTGSDDLWEITYKFAVSPNQKTLTVGTLTVSNKEGWHYAWARFANDIDANAENLVANPIGLYVEQVYEYGSLGGLGIGC